MRTMKRRKVLLVAPLWPLLTTFPSVSTMAAGPELPTSKSLQNDISTALKTSKPLIVLVSLDNCPFCKIARENYLLPLMREQSLAVVQVNLGHSTSIVDPLGKRTTQSDLVKAWAIKATPTVMFLGKNGQEVAPRLVGGSTSDFYGAYLQDRVDQAIKMMQSN